MDEEAAENGLYRAESEVVPPSAMMQHLPLPRSSSEILNPSELFLEIMNKEPLPAPPPRPKQQKKPAETAQSKKEQAPAPKPVTRPQPATQPLPHEKLLPPPPPPPQVHVQRPPIQTMTQPGTGRSFLAPAQVAPTFRAPVTIQAPAPMAFRPVFAPPTAPLAQGPPRILQPPQAQATLMSGALRPQFPMTTQTPVLQLGSGQAGFITAATPHVTTYATTKAVRSLVAPVTAAVPAAAAPREASTDGITASKVLGSSGLVPSSAQIAGGTGMLPPTTPVRAARGPIASQWSTPASAASVGLVTPQGNRLTTPVVRITPQPQRVMAPPSNVFPQASPMLANTIKVNGPIGTPGLTYTTAAPIYVQANGGVRATLMPTVQAKPMEGGRASTNFCTQMAPQATALPTKIIEGYRWQQPTASKVAA